MPEMMHGASNAPATEAIAKLLDTMNQAQLIEVISQLKVRIIGFCPAVADGSKLTMIHLFARA
jgi:hypothetical protein